MKERQEILYEVIRHQYFMLRSGAGGKPNPVVFGSIENYRKFKPRDVGIIRVSAYLPKPLDEYLNSYEFKTTGEVSDKYPSGTPRKIGKRYYTYPDEIRVSDAEKEVRMDPKYTTRLTEIPIKKKI